LERGAGGVGARVWGRYLLVAGGRGAGVERGVPPAVVIEGEAWGSPVAR